MERWHFSVQAAVRQVNESILKMSQQLEKNFAYFSADSILNKLVKQ